MTAPPSLHLLPGEPPLVFVPAGSRLYEIDRELQAALTAGSQDALARFDAAIGESAPLGRDVGDLEAPH